MRGLEWRVVRLDCVRSATSPSMRKTYAPFFATRPSSFPSAEMSAPVTGDSIFVVATSSSVSGALEGSRGNRKICARAFPNTFETTYPAPFQMKRLSQSNGAFGNVSVHCRFTETGPGADLGSSSLIS